MTYEYQTQFLLIPSYSPSYIYYYTFIHLYKCCGKKLNKNKIKMSNYSTMTSVSTEDLLWNTTETLSVL